MIYLVLEKARVGESDRDDESPIAPNWEGIASTQAETEAGAKALMLSNVIEMLNDQSLLVNSLWLRLVYYDDDHATITKVETF